MNIVNKLTIRHLRQNRGRTLITIMAIILSVTMVCCVAGFVMSLRDVLRHSIIEGRGDYHIVYVDVMPEAAELIAGEEVFSSSYTKAGSTEGKFNIYLRMDKPGRDYLEIAGGIAEKYAVEDWGSNNELLALEGVIAQDNFLHASTVIAVVCIIIVVVGSIVVIANAFYISASERVRQFGLLKSAGATSGQIGRSILFEAFLLAALAIPLGILCGYLVQGAVLYLVNNLMKEISNVNNGTLVFRVVFPPLIIYLSVAIAALTVLVSAWLPARRAARTSPIEAIRQTKDIQIRAESLKTPRLIQRLFGFEGALAAKSLKRSRGKYRATVISLSVSIVLFVSMYSFIGILNKSVQMEYGGFDFDVFVELQGDWQALEEADDILHSIEGAKLQKVQRMLLEAIVPPDFITEYALESATTEQRYSILLYPLPEAEFAKIAPQAQGPVSGILVNTTGTFHEDGMIRERIPYNCRVGTELPLGLWRDGEEPLLLGSVTVAAIVTEIPENIPAALFDGSSINILVPETAYRALFLPSASLTGYAVTTSAPDEFCAAAQASLPKQAQTKIMNIAQATRVNRNVVLVIMLFGYGFIAMLSLIAITSVIATISTGMALRRQEFAMLHSVGMTAQGMNKMLNLESLLYGLKSLAIGLPLGTGLSYVLHMAMSAAVEFVWRPPWNAMGISAVAVMLLTFGTMRYSRNKLGKVSIVEALRNETA